ncbi:hypothetical protein D3C73_1222630 [compost metagenome]
MAYISDVGSAQHRVLLRFPDHRPAVCGARAVLGHRLSAAGAARGVLLAVAWRVHVWTQNRGPGDRLPRCGCFKRRRILGQHLPDWHCAGAAQRAVLGARDDLHQAEGRKSRHSVDDGHADNDWRRHFAGGRKCDRILGGDYLERRIYLRDVVYCRICDCSRLAGIL